MGSSQYFFVIVAIVAIVYGLISPYRIFIIFGFLLFVAFTVYRYIIFRAEMEE